MTTKPYNIILILSYSYPYGTGENFLATELPYLKKLCEKIVIIPLTSDDKHNKRETYDYVEVFPPLLLNKSLKSKFLFFISCINSFHVLVKAFYKATQSPDFSLTADKIKRAATISLITAATYSKTIQFQQGSNIIYAYWGNNLAAVLPFLSHGTKKVCRFHGIDLYSERKSNAGFLPLQNEIVSAANKIFLISQQGLNYLSEKHPRHTDKMEVDYLGVTDAPLCSPSTDNIFRIVTCSALIPVKRISTLIKALFLCTNKHLIWTHIGQGPEYAKLFQLADNLPPEIQAVFLGQKSNQDVRLFYATNPVDIFINVSESEGLPVSIMEALCAGIPVIASDVGGMREIITKDCGWIIPQSPAAATIANAIQTVISLPKDEILKRRTNARIEWQSKWNAETNYNLFANSLLNIK